MLDYAYMIVGIGEVGRGAWAGPLVVGAVMLGGADIPGVTDSKKLSAKSRQKYAGLIKKQARSIGLGWVSAENIDKHGLSKALSIAAQLALNEIKAPYTQIIIDGTVRFVDDPRVTTMKQADLLVPSVSAASIMAKVARDYYMSHIAHNDFPDYGFNRHVGYGTAGHLEALQTNGPCDLHRTSFAPIQKIMGRETAKSEKITQNSSGGEAETAAATYLASKGYHIVDRNWKTKWCEVDIIARKDAVIYFVEVKHRAKARRVTD